MDSLSNLTNILRDDGHHFPLLRQADFCKKDNGDVDEKAVKLLSRKSVYPYRLATSISALKAITKFPEKHYFKSDLGGRDENISDEDWLHGQTVWNYWGCKNLLAYTLLYLMVCLYANGMISISAIMTVSKIGRCFLPSRSDDSIFTTNEKQI